MFFLEQPFRAGLRAIEYTRAILNAYLAATAFGVVAAVPLARLLGLRGITLGILVVNVTTVACLGLSLARRLSHGRLSGAALSPTAGSPAAKSGEEKLGGLSDVP